MSFFNIEKIKESIFKEISEELKNKAFENLEKILNEISEEMENNLNKIIANKTIEIFNLVDLFMDKNRLIISVKNEVL